MHFIESDKEQHNFRRERYTKYLTIHSSDIPWGREV